MIGQYFRAGPAEPGAVLLQARQYDLVAVIHVSAAKPRDVPRTGIVPLLRRRRRSHQNKRNDAKEFGHVVTPADRDLQRVLMCSNRRRNAFRGVWKMSATSGRTPNEGSQAFAQPQHRDAECDVYHPGNGRKPPQPQFVAPGPGCVGTALTTISH